ncbi:NACHT domain-containing NTPase [Ktedonobacter sp. SOSP1-52]|uniref:NACHT domain-containing protein n=1 Tax=Ktedonobacter sp. SOSP1-52 TaxID=2778366 RepID=UPI0019151706|nr:NACHT domain-containing protein [Ktedonobacter sp. SOSP1-52]
MKKQRQTKKSRTTNKRKSLRLSTIDQRYQQVERQTNIGHINLFSPKEKENRLYRKRLIGQVGFHWIDDYLQIHSYRHSLRLYEQSVLVHPRRLPKVAKRLVQPEGLLPEEVTLLEVYNQAGGALLLLGESGSGKTILLAQLPLLERAKQDEESLIPIIFPLSTWAVKQQPLAEWLAEELNRNYGIEQNIAHIWVKKGNFIPLLDGLDRVNESCREKCVHAINDFYSQYQQGLVVSCQTNAYQHLSARTTYLELRRAVVVQPLTTMQVERYLEHLGEQATAILSMLRNDPTLHDLLQSPLILDVVTQTFASQPVQIRQVLRDAQEWQKEIFEAYVERMLEASDTNQPLLEAETSRRRARQHHKRKPLYSSGQTKQWLKWLDQQLIQHNQTELYIEYLQFDWLPENISRFTLCWKSTVLFGISLGIIIFLFNLAIMTPLVFIFPHGTSIGSLTISDITTLAGWSGVLIAGGIATFLFYGIDNIRIRPAEIVAWSWSKFRNVLPQAVIGIFSILTLWLVVVLLPQVNKATSPEKNFLLAELITGILYVLFVRLISAGLSGNMLEDNLRLRPNIGIQRSARNSIIAGLVNMGSAFVLTIIGSFALSSADQRGYLIALAESALGSTCIIFSLFMGGGACLLHLTLRMGLNKAGVAPWRYVRFLEYATNCRLLLRVGRSYMFYYPLLLDYFANLSAENKTSSPSRRRKMASRVASSSQKRKRARIARLRSYSNNHYSI